MSGFCHDGEHFECEQFDDCPQEILDEREEYDKLHSRVSKEQLEKCDLIMPVPNEEDEEAYTDYLNEKELNHWSFTEYC